MQRITIVWCDESYIFVQTNDNEIGKNTMYSMRRRYDPEGNVIADVKHCGLACVHLNMFLLHIVQCTVRKSIKYETEKKKTRTTIFFFSSF